MSDKEHNQPDLHKREGTEPGEAQAAPAAEPSPQPPYAGAAGSGQSPSSVSSAMAGVESGKLIDLLRNPSSALNLQPQKDWMYGAIGAIVGVIGFFFWIWCFQEAIKQKLFSVLGNLFLYSILGMATPGKYFLIGLFSVVLLVGTLTVLGNWQGARKRNWMEVVTLQGSSQLLFGAVWIVSGLLAFMSLQLSMLLGAAALLINLLLLVAQAQDFHEVSRERRFLYIVYAMGIYLLLLFFVYSIIV